MLRAREHRQTVTLRRVQGTVRFFGRHPWLLRYGQQRWVARRELRRARVWVRVVGRELAETRASLRPRPVSAQAVICAVFGPYCSQAVRVASCETGGTFSVSASNGQYLGLFQMGDYARSRYGHGSDPWTQARAAFAYFVASGRDWSPWECKP